MIWKFNFEGEKKLEPILKLTQNDAILTLSFNPLTHEMFSGGAADFALYIPGRKEIPKERYREKIMCSAWSADGQTLAFGTVAGTVSFRQRNLDEKVTPLSNDRMKLIWMCLFGAWNGVPSPMIMKSLFCWLAAGIKPSTILARMERKGKDSVRSIFLVTL